MPVVDWVLDRPKKDAFDDFEQAARLAGEASLFYLENGLEKTQQKYN